MNILFLTLVYIDSIEDRGIYHDLMRKFRDEGHQVTIVCPVERRNKQPTKIYSKDKVTFLHIRTLNVQKTNFIEKGLSTLSFEQLFLRSIKKYLNHSQFDLVIYSTPPITFTSIIHYIKKKCGAKSYLLLKDIFPQNALDLNIISKKNPFYHYFRNKEKKLYQYSDFIGCMSPANVRYVLDYNHEVPEYKVHVNPNSIEPKPFRPLSEEEKNKIRSRYSLPTDQKIFIYGGNLGIPQGIDFLMEVIEHCNNKNAYFLIVGSGTEYLKIKEWFSNKKPENAKLISSIPKNDFDFLLSACDVGLIFLHRNFTIPNFPSRLLSYLEYGKPVLCATDSHTDIGTIVQENCCGYSVLSGDTQGFLDNVDELCQNDLSEMQNNALKLVNEKYHVNISYNKILEKINFKNV